jgi:hypothetical protein
MSNLIMQPPPSIQIGGGDPGAGPGGPGGPAAPAGPQRPPGGPAGGAQAFVAALKKLAADAQSAIDLSDDPIDKSELANLAASIHKMIAGEQSETDKMMGGGISPRAIRRGGSAASGGAAPGGGY